MKSCLTYLYIVKITCYNVQNRRYNVFPLSLYILFIMQYGGGTDFLENLNMIVAQNLKRYREEKKLSLEKVSEMSGVSKTMLSQIERGESSPTISTLWKIATGLKVTFTELVDKPMPDTALVHKDDVGPITEDSGKYRIYLYYPYEDGRRFEIYTIEIDPGGTLISEPHGEGTQEFLTVFGGTLSIRVGDDEYAVQYGSSIRFKADRPHSYRNLGSDMVRMNNVIYYPK
jgi:XRE family transcriptional regulator, regulator of sulfur utilization